MKAFIIDPVTQTFEETTLPAAEKASLELIKIFLESDQYFITFIYPTEYRTCTAYVCTPKKGAAFFRVTGFVDAVRFGKTVIVDKTATGYPKSDHVTLAEVQPMINFFSKGKTR